MIKFELRCAEGHGFEAWFRNGETYEAQAAAGEISCPSCGDVRVAKAPMAPRIAKGPGGARGDQAEADRARRAEMLRALAEIRRKVEESCDYVGETFAEEARRIHYGEAEARGIYGETSDEQAQELAEEGIDFGRVPWLPPSDT